MIPIEVLLYLAAGIPPALICLTVRFADHGKHGHGGPIGLRDSMAFAAIAIVISPIMYVGFIFTPHMRREAIATVKWLAAQVGRVLLGERNET